MSAFASGIPATNGVAQPATCDTGTLETATGSAQLRANFTPEVITLKWYNDGVRITVPTASNTCTYDTATSLPTNPTKPGYKFKGWKVVPKFDFSTMDYTFTPISKSSDDTNKIWSVTIPNGTIYGDALCSDTQGTTRIPGDPGEPNVNGQYCWCHVIGYTPNGDTAMRDPSSDLPWVFHAMAGGYAGYACKDLCANLCVFRFADDREDALLATYGFRQALFGQLGS